MRTAITTTQLSKHYPGIVALDDVTLDIPEGSVYGFLGPNGAGKSTLIKILAGLTRPTGGSAVIGGIPLANGSAHRRQIGYLGQEPRFYDWMTGRETLRYVAGFHPWITDPVERRIDEALRLTGIADAGSRRTGTYSGGMRQRLGIAQALIGRPQVLLLDEPASALDPAGRRDVLDLMRGAPRRGDDLLLHPHPRRRPAGLGPRRDPRRGPARRRGSYRRAPGVIQPGSHQGRPARGERGHDG